MDKPIGDKKHYKTISKIIFISFFINGTILLILNLNCIEPCLQYCLTHFKIELIKQFFYGSLGATIFSSFFLSNDIEINELESLNENPDLTKLRYPTKEDINLYIQRIISSGFLAIVGTFVLMGGFSYLDVDVNVINLKQKILFALVSFLIGLFQGNFYAKLESVFKRIFNSDK